MVFSLKGTLQRSFFPDVPYVRGLVFSHDTYFCYSSSDCPSNRVVLLKCIGKITVCISSLLCVLERQVSKAYKHYVLASEF